MSTLIIDDINHNQYYDTGDPNNNIVLTNCTYVRCGDGCTGTITNVNNANIGENNTLAIQDSSYIQIGDDNRDLVIRDGSYIIVGDHNNGVTIGRQQNPNTAISRTGATSISVGTMVVGVGITGQNMRINKTSYSEIDGICNKIDNSSGLYLNDCTGNKITKSSTVEMVRINNNELETNNMTLVDKDPFMCYTKNRQVISATSLITPIVRQSDNVGTVLDTQMNTLINVKDNSKGTEQVYTKVGGIWTLVEQKK